MESALEPPPQPCAPSRHRRRRILFVCEDYVPPTNNGSSLVYEACLRTLSAEHDVFAIMCGDPETAPPATRAALDALCAAHLIIPHSQSSAALKLARLLGRRVSGALLAPRALEELGRGRIYRRVRDFIALHQPDLLYIHKFDCAPRIGLENIRAFAGPKMLDLHDDFVRREQEDRRIIRDLFARYPRLSHYKPYATIRLKYRLSRFSAAAARRQELGVLNLFDRILIASAEEFGTYGAYLPEKVAHAPWPMEFAGQAAAGAPRFDAGFIGSDSLINLEGLMTFVTTCLPRIVQENPRFSFAIAGGVCAPFALAAEGLDLRGVTVLGRVEAVSSFYAAVGVVVAPILSGTGVSLKLQEAAGFGRPVITTPRGARGLAAGQVPANVTICPIEAFPARLAAPVAEIEAGARANPRSDYLAAFARFAALAGAESDQALRA